jgi:hypothetical protein
LSVRARVRNASLSARLQLCGMADLYQTSHMAFPRIKDELMSFSRSKVKGHGHDGVNLEKPKSGHILLIPPQILLNLLLLLDITLGL